MATRIRALRISLRPAFRSQPRARPVTIGAHPFTWPGPRLHGHRALLLVPVVGGLTYFLLPSQPPQSNSFLSSPALIPCRPQPQPMIIASPIEEERSILSRILQLLRDRIWEPLLTARRFIHLCFIFVPVMVVSPMLLVGLPEKELQGDRWGAVWWYDLLVAQMARAGPTFVKVSRRSSPMVYHVSHYRL